MKWIFIKKYRNLTKIALNNPTNNSVLAACAKQQINIIVASSIMVMDGNVMLNEKICAALQKQPMNFAPVKRLTVDSPLSSNESMLKRFNEGN